MAVTWAGDSCGNYAENVLYNGFSIDGLTLAVGDVFHMTGLHWQRASFGLTTLTEPPLEDVQLHPVAELRQCWQTASGDQLMELRLYYPPEETAGGRTVEHGDVSCGYSNYVLTCELG